MKRYFFVLFMIFALVGLTTNVFSEPEVKKEEIKMKGGMCPITQVSGKIDDCMECHLPKTFKIKESLPFEDWEMPNYSSSMIIEDNKPVGKFKIYGSVGGSDPRNLDEFFIYLDMNHKEVKKMVIEIHSPGGSLFEGYKTIGVMKYWRSKGYKIETRVHGFAASAAFFIFCGGDTRLVSPEAELMWHELITFAMFDVSGPADKEDQAAVLRHLQDTANTMLSEVSNMTKDEIDQKIRKKEYWMNGRQAFEDGFATGILE
jgi:ATP-dependent protease ClpP protease subunit